MPAKKETNSFDNIKTKANNIVSFYDRDVIKNFVNTYYNRYDKDLYYTSPYYFDKRKKIMFNVISKPFKNI